MMKNKIYTTKLFNLVSDLVEKNIKEVDTDDIVCTIKQNSHKYDIDKNLTWQIKINSVQCPYCKTNFKSDVIDIKNYDYCPVCGKRMINDTIKVLSYVYIDRQGYVHAVSNLEYVKQYAYHGFYFTSDLECEHGYLSCGSAYTKLSDIKEHLIKCYWL